jgi:pyruvate dehydrogenase E1 component
MPNCTAYDPAFAYELAVVLEDGMRRMLEDEEDLIYYVTVENEPYEMPPMPADCRDGILRGLYRFRQSKVDGGRPRAALLGSGAILNETIQAAQMLEDRYGIAADVWSATSYKNLHRDGLEAERRNRLHPEAEAEPPYVTRCLGDDLDVVVAASDYVKALPHSIARWIPAPLEALGTDGFGRSEGRRELRDFFEVDARHIVAATLSRLAREGKVKANVAAKAFRDLEIDPERPDPVTR